MREPFFEETFTGNLHPQLQWHCEPSQWSVDTVRKCLRIQPDSGTDFWQRTHYGFAVDNGHFLFTPVNADFVMTTHVRFQPVHQFDQAGLMVRVSPSCWLKTSVEFEPEGPSRLGAVVTNNAYSDWSTQDFASGLGEVWLGVHRDGDDYRVESSIDGRRWSQLRVAHFHEGHNGTVQCGVYACSPQGAGFVAEFDDLRIDIGCPRAT